MTEHETMTADTASLAPDDVVEAIKQLGQEAVDQFLAGLQPHASALLRGEEASCEAMFQYLRHCAIEAAILHQAGGLDSFRERADSYSKDTQSLDLKGAITAIDKLKFG